MKAKVLRTFRDKHTKELHKAGAVIDVTKKRAEEINSALSYPLIELVRAGAKQGG